MRFIKGVLACGLLQWSCMANVADAAVATIGPTQEIVYVNCTGDDTDRGRAFRDALENAHSNTIISLCNGTHRVSPRSDWSGVLIERPNGLTGLTVQGCQIVGCRSVVKFERTVYLGLAIGNGVSNLTLRGFTIEGSLTKDEAGSQRFRRMPDGSIDETSPCKPEIKLCFSAPGQEPNNPNTHGIAFRSGIRGNVLITQIELNDLAVGIDASSGSSSCKSDPIPVATNVTISNNRISQMHGVDAGSGYGIVTSCSENVLVIDNIVANTGRHAIYHGRSADNVGSGNVRIIRNTIVDHGRVYGKVVRWAINRAALVFARGGHGSIVNNTFIGGHAYSISVERDHTNPSAHAKNNAIIGNHFVDISDTRPKNIWIDVAKSDEVVVVWGNTNARRTGRVPSEFIQCDMTVYLSSPIPCKDDPVFWQAGVGTQWIEFVGNAKSSATSAGDLEAMFYLAVMQNNVLHRVIPVWGAHPGSSNSDHWNYTYSTTDWSAGLGFGGMAQMGGYIYVMQNSILHKVTPRTTTGAWEYVYSTTSWYPKFSSIATMGDGKVYVVQYNALHTVTPAGRNGAWPYVPWRDIGTADVMRAAGGIVYVLRNTAISKYYGLTIADVGDPVD